jgi:hypothetical protein
LEQPTSENTTKPNAAAIPRLFMSTTIPRGLFRSTPEVAGTGPNRYVFAAIGVKPRLSGHTIPEQVELWRT